MTKKGRIVIGIKRRLASWLVGVKFEFYIDLHNFSYIGQMKFEELDFYVLLRI